MGKKKFTTVRIKLTTSEIGWEKMQGVTLICQNVL